MTRLRTISTALALLLGALAAYALSLPAKSWVEPSVTAASVREAVVAHPSTPLEGLWSATGSGTCVAIVRGHASGAPRSLSPDACLLVLLRSASAGIPAGTVIGVCTPSAREGSYDARLYTRRSGRSLTSPRRFTLTLTDGQSRLTATEVHTGLRVDIWRLLPYPFRSVVHSRNDRPRNLDGFVRLWPQTAAPPTLPRQL